MIIYYVKSSLNRRSATVVNLNLIEVGALLATLGVTLIGNIYVMNNTLPLSQGDMWRHLAQALQYSKGFPVHEGILIPGYPYLFHVCLATFFQLSGLPSPISYQALFALSFIPVLSFYSFIKEWFSKKNLCSITVLLIPLLGFGSLYGINLKTQNPSITLPSVLSNAISKTYDINDIMVIGPALSNVVPILYIALPTLFMFLYLLRKNINSVTKSFLYAVLVAVSFLGHADASFFMGLTLLLYAVIIKGEGVKAGAIGGILGLLIVSLVDVSAPARIYIGGLGGLSSSNIMTFFVTFLLFVLSYITSVLVRRFHINHNFVSSNFKKTFPLISSIILFAYVFSLITWVYVLPSYDAYKFGGYNLTPFFIWPIRFGPVGLLSILCLSLYLGDVVKDKRLTFFLAIAAIGFAMEQLANYYPIYPAYRFATLTLIGVVALAAYFVARSSLSLAGKKRMVLTALLIFVMIPGMLSSSLFYYDRAPPLASTINSYELDALSFVGQNLSSNSSVLTFTSDSQIKLETFGGVNTIQIMQKWYYIFLNEVDSSILLYLLGTSNVKYIYLSPYDFEALNRSKNMLHDLLNYLPVAFQNEGVTIYEIPRIVPPSTQSNFIILNFLESDTTASEHATSQSESLLQTIPSLLQLNYTISSLPIEANRTFIAIAGLQNSSQWTTTEGIGNISLNETNIEESAAIAVQNLTADKNGYFAIGTKYSGDFTHFDYLQLWVKVSSDVDGEVKVILRGDNNTWAAWLIQNFSKNEWFPLALQLTKPNLESTTQLDLSAIRRVDIDFQKLHPTANYSFLKIGGIQGIISSRFLPYEALNSLFGTSSTIMLTYDPNFDASSLLKLAESGSKIIVFDTCDDNKGFFFNFLQLAVKGYVESNEIALSTNINIPQTQVPSISTNSSDVSPTAYYKLGGTSVAPFVLVKKIGLGEIAYIILPSKIINTSEKTLALLMTIFNEIAGMQGLQTKTYKYSPNHFESYNTLEGLTTLNGKIKISAEHIFNTNPLKSSRLEIRTGNTSEVLANITIDSLKIYGPAQLVLDGQSIKMQANSVSSYLTIFSDKLERPCLLELSDNTIVDLSIMNSSELFSLRMSGGSLLLDTSELSMLVKQPSIEAQGDIYFESATINYINPYVPLAEVVRDGLKISGHTVFTVQFTLRDLSIITDFSYDGTAVANKIPTTTQLNISWLSLLTSPTSFVFYLLLLVFALLFIIRKQIGCPK
jgi:hypothetical protein